MKVNHIEYTTITQWMNAGKPSPPPDIIKKITILTYAKQFNINIMIETGTFQGTTINSVKEHFKRIYTIELGEELYNKAKEKFIEDKHISLYKGDSSTILPKLLKEVNSPCIFWLDAHYSGGITVRGKKDTPINEELKTILNHHVKNHIILIDDAREFNGKNLHYPSIEELNKKMTDINPDIVFHVENDIIRIYEKLN